MVAELLFSSSVEFLTRQLCGVPILGLVSIVPVDDEIEPFPFNCPTVLGTAASAGLRGKL